MENKQTDEKGRPITYWGGKQNKQQTAVEWLAEKIYLEGLDDEFVTQAKQMENEQKFRFFIAGHYQWRKEEKILNNTTTKPINKKYIFILRDGLRYEVDQNTYDYFINCATIF